MIDGVGACGGADPSNPRLGDNHGSVTPSGQRRIAIGKAHSTRSTEHVQLQQLVHLPLVFSVVQEPE